MVCSRFLAVTLSAALLASCSSGGGDNNAPFGYVVGDEPLAVQAGASVLANGGSAADAAAAIYFALSATYPVAAGLGGGGLCIVHDTTSGRTDEFDFLARNTNGGGAYAVPGNVRGFSALQSVYGRLPWQRDVAPGEALATTGFPISRALAERLTRTQDVVRLDANMASEFLDESGQVKPAGTVVSNSDLGQTLTAIRQLGPNGFYQGPISGGLIMYSSSQNGALTANDLVGYRVERNAPQATRIAGQVAYLPSSRVGAGAFAGSLLSNLSSVDQENSANAVGSAVKAALDQYRIASLPQDLGATSFAAVDASGQAVACAVTMNGPFGSGHTAQGTGVVLAKAPGSGDAGLAAAFLTPIVATDGDGGSVTLAGAGAGGPNGTASIAYALVKLARGEDMTQPDSLRSTGMAPFDTVNVIICQSGTCATLPDPAANGLGVAAGPAP